WTLAGSQFPDGQNIHSAGRLSDSALGSESFSELPLPMPNTAVGFASSSFAKISGRNRTVFLLQTSRKGRRSVTLRSCAWRTSWLKPSKDCFSRLFAMTPLKLGTASKSISNNIKILSAISISVNARNRCTGKVTRSTQNHNRSGGLPHGRPTVDCGKSNGSRPPRGIRAIFQKHIHQRVIDFTRTD